MQFTLRQARRYRDKTIAEMANALGVNKSTYIKLEQNPCNIKLSTAVDISSYLEIPLDDIIFLAPKST